MTVGSWQNGYIDLS